MTLRRVFALAILFNGGAMKREKLRVICDGPIGNSCRVICGDTEVGGIRSLCIQLTPNGLNIATGQFYLDHVDVELIPFLTGIRLSEEG